MKVKGRGFPGGSVVKNPPTDAGATGSIPGPGRSHMPCVRLPSPCATTADAYALPEKLPHNEQPALHSLRKAACSNEDPGQPKINK